ncbi:Uncharacterized protein HZ326_12385 [Fusarium oxysporum f. sp. albedinis]|nr:Uncharacterized protein HZ326_12385 [Fusarium oxysporum f. sp. albedinis]
MSHSLRSKEGCGCCYGCKTTSRYAEPGLKTTLLLPSIHNQHFQPPRVPGTENWCCCILLHHPSFSYPFASLSCTHNRHPIPQPAALGDEAVYQITSTNLVPTGFRLL